MPKVVGYVPSDRAEREVLHRLKQQLPHDCVVMAGVDWSIEDDRGFVRDGQADFVVLIPGSGMVILEVKGSREFWVGDDGRWHRRAPNGQDVPLNESPHSQATRNMHELARRVCKRLGWPTFRGRYACVVVYPNGRASQLPAMFEHSTLVTSAQLHELGSRLRVALAARGPEAIADQFDMPTCARVADILACKDFAITPADTRLDAVEDSERIDALTSQQFAALRGVFDLPRVAVVGPAGSGKTLIAIWRLRALLESGARAMYVCFNRDLAAMLRRRNPDFAQAITHVDKFFYQFADGGASAHGDRYFRHELPEQALRAAEAMADSDKFDAIIVDEGQDLGEDQLISLYCFLKQIDATWVFFADWRQDLFQAGKGAAIGAEVLFRLYHNCRNTVSINSATNDYLQQHVLAMPGLPEGLLPLVIATPTPTASARQAWDLARQWAPDGGAVILSPYRLENSSMKNSRAGNGMKLSESLEDLGNPNTVYFSTIRSFKGMEAPVVIVVDIDVPNVVAAFTNEDLYVACTRATARLALLPRTDGFATWLQRP